MSIQTIRRLRRALIEIIEDKEIPLEQRLSASKQLATVLRRRKVGRPRKDEGGKSEGTRNRLLE